MIYSNNFLFLAKYQYTKMSIVSKVDRMAKTQSFNIIHKLQKKEREKKLPVITSLRSFCCKTDLPAQSCKNLINMSL